LDGGDVRPGPLGPPAEFKVGFGAAVDQPVEFLGPPFGVVAKVVGHLNVDASDMNVHL
jgi:hypothetical protein